MAFLRQRGKKNLYSIVDKERDYTEPLKTDRYDLAKIALDKYNAEKFYGKHDLPQSDKNFQEFKDEYLPYAKQNRRFRTYIKLEYILNKFQEIVMPGRMGSISSMHCEKFQTARLSKKLSPSTVRTECCYLSSAFQKAVAWKFISSNPWKEVPKIEPPKHEPKSFSVEEQELILREFKKEAEERRIPAYYIGALLALRQGLRISEIVHLRREDIDLKRNEISLVSYPCPCYFCAEGNGVYEIKNRMDATIPIMDVELLRVLKETYQPLGKGPICIFTISGFQKLMRRILERNNMYVPRKLVHALRHSTGINQLDAGSNIRAIQRLLRHRSLSSTEIYTTQHDDQLRQELGKFKPRALLEVVG